MNAKAETREVSFAASKEARELARKIARRARNLYLEARVDRDTSDIEMDLIATHANGWISITDPNKYANEATATLAAIAAHRASPFMNYVAVRA